VAKAPPDGHTLLLGVTGSHSINTTLYKKMPYHPLNDFEPLTQATIYPNAIVVHPQVPASNLQELIALVKREPARYSYGSDGNGTASHLGMEILKSRAGMPLTHVPYKGSAPILNDLIGGQVQATFDGITGLTAQIRAGKIRLLAVTNATKVWQFPDAPTVNETVPGYTSGGWFGYIAPAGTPTAIVQRLNTAINTAMKQPEVIERLGSAGLIVVTESPAYFDNVIRSDYAKYGKLVKDIGFVPQ